MSSTMRIVGMELINWPLRRRKTELSMRWQTLFVLLSASQRAKTLQYLWFLPEGYAALRTEGALVIYFGTRGSRTAQQSSWSSRRFLKIKINLRPV